MNRPFNRPPRHAHGDDAAAHGAATPGGANDGAGAGAGINAGAVGAGVLAQLVAQSDDALPRGVALRAMIEQASEAGAQRALDRLGLSDAAARDDISDLRELLGAWRDAKRSAWSAVVDWAVRGCLALVLIGIAMKTGFGAWVK